MELITPRIIFILTMIVISGAAASKCEQVNKLIERVCVSDSAVQVNLSDSMKEAIGQINATRGPLMRELQKNIDTLNNSVSTFIEDYNSWSNSCEPYVMAAARSLLRVQFSNEMDTELYLLLQLSVYSDFLKTQESRWNFHSVSVSDRLGDMRLSLNGTVCTLKRMNSSGVNATETDGYHDCKMYSVSSELRREYTLVVVKMIWQTLNGIKLNSTSESVHWTEPADDRNGSPILNVGRVLSRKRICGKMNRKPQKTTEKHTRTKKATKKHRKPQKA